jgi:hypothetical protein
MCIFSKFFPNAEDNSAYTFEKIQSDSDDDDQWNVEDISNFSELVLWVFYVLVSISPLFTNHQKHLLKNNYSNFIRLWFSNRTTSVLHVAVLDPFNLENIKLILE